MKKILTQTKIDAFERHLRIEERSDATIEKYLHDVRVFFIFLDGRKVEKEGVIAYKNYLSKEYAIASANSMLAALNSFFRFLGWLELCVRQFKVQRKVYVSDEKELSKSEYLRLLETANRRNRTRLSLILQTICASGIRVSELKFITVEAVMRGEALVNCKGKSRKVFIIKPLQRKLLRYIKEQRIRTGEVFLTRKGKSIPRNNIWREMKSLCEEANVKPSKVFPHNLRHLFARTFWNLEKDIAKLADILGHTSINTTRIYIVTTGIEHQRKMENMRLIL